MEPTLSFLTELLGKKVQIRYKGRPEGGGSAAPYEGTLVATDGAFLKLNDLGTNYAAPGTGTRAEVMIALDAVATIELSQ